jgi:hypothetical protein
MNNGQVTLSDSVATQLTEVGLMVVALKADPANTTAIWIGDENVSETTGFPLNPGETIVIAVDRNLNVLYGIAETADEIVCWIETGR